MEKDKDIVVENLSEQLLVELKRIRLLLVVIVFVLIVGCVCLWCRFVCFRLVLVCFVCFMFSFGCFFFAFCLLVSYLLSWYLAFFLACSINYKIISFSIVMYTNNVFNGSVEYFKYISSSCALVFAYSNKSDEIVTNVIIAPIPKE